jgi:hypothetical protein
LAPGRVTDDQADTGAPPGWALLPDAIRADVEALAGSRVTGASTARGALRAGACVRVTFARGTRLLLKYLPADHPLVPRYRDEAALNGQSPGHVPVLRLRRAWQTGDWWVMTFHDLAGARHPDLTPGSPDIARSLLLLDRLTTAVTPAPICDAPAFADDHANEIGGWQHLADTAAHLDPWSARNLDRLTSTERYWRHHVDGTTLIHADLGPDTMLLADVGDVVTDWAFPHQGAAWIDPALFLLHLIHAGHTLHQAETLMEASVTAWTDASRSAITFFIIALTGY